MFCISYLRNITQNANSINCLFLFMKLIHILILLQNNKKREKLPFINFIQKIFSIILILTYFILCNTAFFAADINCVLESENKTTQLNHSRSKIEEEGKNWNNLQQILPSLMFKYNYKSPVARTRGKTRYNSENRNK